MKGAGAHVRSKRLAGALRREHPRRLMRARPCAMTWMLLPSALMSVGCRRTAPDPIRAEPSAKTIASAPPSASSRGDASTDGASDEHPTAVIPPAPMPMPPTIACASDPRVRWAVPGPDDEPHNNGTARFDCSPMKTGDAPFELTVAPGTILSFPVRVELGSSPTTDFAEAEATYKTAGLPTGAWVDPADKSFKWHVRGADGDAFAFSVAAVVALPDTGTSACVVASMRVRVKDDDDTRLAQAEYMDDGASGAWRLTYMTPDPTDPDWVKQDHDEKCGAATLKPSFRDADGDGLKDAIFVYPYRGGGTPNSSDVLLRRGDTFAKLEGTPGELEFAADGTTFLVDRFSAGTGYSCSIGIKIAQVFKNRVSIVVDEDHRGELDSATSECPPGDGMIVDHAAGAMIGFSDQGRSTSGVVTKRVWRWDGKKFALAP